MDILNRAQIWESEKLGLARQTITKLQQVPQLLHASPSFSRRWESHHPIFPDSQGCKESHEKNIKVLWNGHSAIYM